MTIETMIAHIFIVLVLLSFTVSQIIKNKILKLKNLEEKYNLTSSKYGRDGIESALNILLNQEEQAMKIRPIAYPKNLITLLSSSSSSISNSDNTLLPVCEVSYSQIMRNGLFLYLGIKFLITFFDMFIDI